MTPNLTKPSVTLKIILSIVIIGAISFIMLTAASLLGAAPVLAQTNLPISVSNPQELLQSALNWIEGLGYIGGAAFMLIYIIATLAFLPGSVLTLGAGVVFGVVLGSVYVFIGATFGAIAAFLVGRYLLRNWISKKIEGNEKFVAIDKAVAKEGFKIVLLTRLSPIFPFNLLNYAFGVTKVSLKHYSFASVGMIPGTVMYVYIGSLVGNIARIGAQNPSANLPLQWILQIVGLIATIAVTVYVAHISRQALTKQVDE
jgi:uncharacterized membrane protein YdjX (TVP38/TMEM64 family)